MFKIQLNSVFLPSVYNRQSPVVCSVCNAIKFILTDLLKEKLKYEAVQISNLLMLSKKPKLELGLEE